MYSGVPIRSPVTGHRGTAGNPDVADEMRKAEVGDNHTRLARPGIVEHHVVALEVPVDHACGMGGGERCHHLFDDRARVLERQRAHSPKSV
jgi:hypothetical protein